MFFIDFTMHFYDHKNLLQQKNAKSYNFGHNFPTKEINTYALVQQWEQVITHEKTIDSRKITGQLSQFNNQ